MSQEAQIRVSISSGKLKITDEEGKPPRRLTKLEKRRFKDDPGTYIATATIFKKSEIGTERSCIVINIGGTDYKICI